MDNLCRLRQPDDLFSPGEQLVMRYFEIAENDAASQADAQRGQREKITAAQDKIAQASQTYQSSIKQAHASAAAAKKKLAMPPPAVKPITSTSPLKPLAALPPIR